MIGELLYKLGQRKIRLAARRYQEKGLLTAKEWKEVGILWLMDSKNYEFRKIDEITNFFKQFDAKTTIIGYSSKPSKRTQTIPIYSRQDFNSMGLPKNEDLKFFTKKRFQCFLLAGHTPDGYANNIISLCNSPTKIGLYSPNSRLDVMFKPHSKDIPLPDFLLAQLYKYLVK